MKRTTIFCTLAVCLVWAAPAKAMIVDLPDEGGVGFFLDQNTGYTWMDVDNFFGLSYTSIVTGLIGSDFHVATLEEIGQLKLAAPADVSLFNLHASIMGVSPTQNLIWGYYDDDGITGNGGSWNFKWGPNTFGEPTDVWFTPLGTGTNQIFADLGGWAVNTHLPPAPVIPEPGTLTLFAAGLASRHMIRRGRKA